MALQIRKIDNTRACFFDLPPELRNIIYQDALTVPQDYEITASHERTGLEIYEDEVLGGRERTGVQIIHRTNDLDRRNVSLTPALLRTSRAVNLEAAPILYGANTFALWGPSFLDRIGSNVKHIRRVHLVYTNQKGLKIFLKKMKESPQIDELVFGFSNFTGVKDAKRLEQLVGPYVRWLHRQRRGTDKRAALEVVSFQSKDDDGLREYGEYRRRIRVARELIETSLR